MTPASLVAALRACAAGLYPLEAGTGLLIAHGTFLQRDDFTSRFVLHGTAGMAAVDRDAVPGLDQNCLHLAVTAIRRAAGQHP